MRTLNAARLAADVAGVSSLIVARTDAEAATLLQSDIDERDHQFLTGERSSEGFYYIKNGLEPSIARAKAYAPYSDLLWMETSTPDLDVARQFAEAVKAEFPDQMLAYNCSPSFNWKANLDDETIASFQRELASMGYTFQFITLAGFHSLNYSMFNLAKGYADRQMSAFVELQEAEFAAEKTVSPRPVTSAKLALAISTPSLPPSTQNRPPPLWLIQPKHNSSSPPRPDKEHPPWHRQLSTTQHLKAPM